MYSDSPVVQLCIAGSQAEFDGRCDEAARLYAAAWDAATDDFEACVAAHYVARFQPDAEATLYWNQVALARAESVNDERVRPFFPSLYLNLGQSYEVLGQPAVAQQYYSLSAALGFPHQPDRG